MSSTQLHNFALHCSIAAMLGACGGATGQQTCVHDEDCASGFCRADGTCAAAGDDGGAGPDARRTDGGGGGDGTIGGCTPNHDGQISRDELPLGAGQMAKFRVSTSATWDTAGTTGSNGSHTWDLSGALTGDQDQTITLASPSGAYWGSAYPDATYSTQLAAGSDVVGVFHVTDTAVQLLAVESPNSGGTTHLAYDPPAQILKIPFQAGDTWSSSSTVTGTLAGVFANYTETYASRVDAVGTMTTPYGAFPVLRVATDLADVQITTTFNSSRTFAWSAECFGTVAKATSQPLETSDEFDDPAEVERLVP